LAHWLEADPYAAQHWRIVGVGEDGSNPQLTDWQSMTSLGKLTLSDYRDLLRRAKVGLALMLSPHPSYPPLEMSAFGMRVVTNGFGPKDLSRFGDAIQSVSDLAPNVIAAALRRATEACESGRPDVISFDPSAVFMSDLDLDTMVIAVADDIRSELGVGCESDQPKSIVSSD
jgi:hypothetical protein